MSTSSFASKTRDNLCRLASSRGWVRLEAPRTFCCDDCGRTIAKGSDYWHRSIGSPSGSDTIDICYRCLS